MQDDLQTLISRWFAITKDEQRLIAAILVIAIIGTAARYVHLSRLKADVYAPAPRSSGESIEP